MKKIWSYLAVGFAFFSGGIIVAVKWLAQNKVIVNVKKQRIRGNSNEMIVDVAPVIKGSQKRLKRTKEQRKADRDERRSK